MLVISYNRILFLLCSLFFVATLALNMDAANPSQELFKAIQDKSIKSLKKVTDELAKQNDDGAFETLHRGLNLLGTEPDIEMFWIILQGMARFTDRAVIQKIAGLIVQNKKADLGNALLKAFSSNQSAAVIPLLKEVLEKGTDKMQTECLRQLGNIQSKESIEALIGILKTTEPLEKKRKGFQDTIFDSLNLLVKLGHKNYVLWIEWWEKNKDKPTEELIRKRAVITDTSKTTLNETRSIKIIIPSPEKVLVVRNDECDETIMKAGGKGFDGNFDHIENVLAAITIPYTLIGKSALEREGYSLDDKWALIFNCNYYSDHCCNPEHLKLPPTNEPGGKPRTSKCPGTANHINHTTQLSRKALQKIYRFVEAGGYLFTEDLNVNEILSQTFKKTVASSKDLDEKTVRIMPALEAVMHPYLRYVFEAPPMADAASDADSGETRSVMPGQFSIDAEWKIDQFSPSIKILDPKTVTVLIVSPVLARENDDSGAVAVTFAVSNPSIKYTGAYNTGYLPGGRVLHVMSHFGKQRSKISEFALQNLLVNFLEELSERRRTLMISKK